MTAFKVLGIGCRAFRYWVFYNGALKEVRLILDRSVAFRISDIEYQTLIFFVFGFQFNIRFFMNINDD